MPFTKYCGDILSQPGELVSAAAAGVVSITLSSIPAVFDFRADNSIIRYGSFHYLTSGGFASETREAIAVAFTTDQVNTRFVLPTGFAYNPEVFKLPNLRAPANDNFDIFDEWCVA
jgi:hypothetical protein